MPKDPLPQPHRRLWLLIMIQARHPKCDLPGMRRQQTQIHQRVLGIRGCDVVIAEEDEGFFVGPVDDPCAGGEFREEVDGVAGSM